jgi:prepilin-type N-terminal cleavage/methylation domain-containing protein
MNKFSVKKNQSGFTLLELLIVIAIIGIMSAIAAASLGLSREKGRNSARVSQIKEYQKAFELYRSENVNGVYPTYPATAPPISAIVCLGDYPDDRCFGNSGLPGAGSANFERATFNSLLSPQYLRIMPPGETRLFGPEGNKYEGMTYRHQQYGESYTIQYFMEGQVDCGLSGATGATSGPDTLCTLNYPQ